MSESTRNEASQLDLAQVQLTLDSNLLTEHTDPFNISDDKLSLHQLIPRIIFEKGTFLNLTEERLQKDIANGESLESSPSLEADAEDMRMLDDGEESGVPTGTSGPSEDLLSTEDGAVKLSANEEFFKNKSEMLTSVSLALNESALSLDMVSLLISCVRPAAGTISMSAHLKKFVPPGSLNADRVINSITPEQKQKRLEEDRVIGQGWKLTSIEAASSSLRNASIRLIEDVLKEKIFWDIIMKNFDNKEILYKTRDKQTGKRVFAVKYGYEDSGSTYKVSGNALLRRVGTKEQLEFVPISNSNNPLVNRIKKILRVRILKRQPNEDDFVITGESSINDTFPKDDSIKSQIDKARFFIFEEELFSQLIEEANVLISYDVKVENESKLTIEVSNDEILEIEATEYNEDSSYDEDCSINRRTDDNRANVISSYLRLMLTIKFKKNLQAKQKATMLRQSSGSNAPSTQSRLHSTYSSILRPLVGQFRHEQQLEKFYQAVKDLLQSSLGSEFKFRKHSNLTKSQLKNDPLKKISTIPVSKFMIKVNDSLRIDVLLDSFDYVNHVYHLNAFKSDEVFGNAEKEVVNVNFEELHQIIECLEWIIEEYK